MKNQILTKKRPITLDNSTTPINYHIETSTLLVSNEDQIVNTITADISKTFIQKDSFGTLFSLEVKNRKQSNLDGNASLENELAWLQQELILYCNDKGEIINIVNREHIKEEWFSRKKEIKKSHKYIIDDIDIILQGTIHLLEQEGNGLKFVFGTLSCVVNQFSPYIVTVELVAVISVTSPDARLQVIIVPLGTNCLDICYFF